MVLTVTTERGPAYWAPYLINGDPSSLTDAEITEADDWVQEMDAGRVVSCDEEYEFERLWYKGRVWFAGETTNYVFHKGSNEEVETRAEREAKPCCECGGADHCADDHYDMVGS